MRYRNQLPQTHDKTCLTDGGLETVMIYQEGIDLPAFASYTLLQREDGRDNLQRYFQPYIEIAREHRLGLQLESVTWRANTDWGATLGHEELDQSTELDAGNPVEFGQQYQDLRQMLPNLNTFGGCCGTDHNHIGAICESCFPVASPHA